MPARFVNQPPFGRLIDKLAELAARPQQERRARERGAGNSTQSIAGMLWFAGWLFTLGLAKLVWWKALLALVVWPYFLGITFR